MATGEPNSLKVVTVREAAELVGLTVSSVYRLMLAARVRGEPAKSPGSRYVLLPGQRRGNWERTYYLGSLLRAVGGSRRVAA